MTNELAVQIAGGLLSLVIGYGGVVPVVDWVKRQLNLKGRETQLLVVVVVVVYTILVLFAQGTLTVDALTAENIVAVFLLIAKAAQDEYLRVRKLQEKDVEST